MENVGEMAEEGKEWSIFAISKSWMWVFGVVARLKQAFFLTHDKSGREANESEFQTTIFILNTQLNIQVFIQ